MKTTPSFCLLLSLTTTYHAVAVPSSPEDDDCVIKSSNYINMSYEQDGAEAKEIAKYLRKWQSVLIVFCYVLPFSMIDETRTIIFN